ncbi:MAG: alpha-amylase family glycosyl hydrolase, partial [Kiritimatiellae bacterium]|nr:alpha-amylase family glycosyl hydrolase [Kiritimatiellia bacterium]
MNALKKITGWWILSASLLLSVPHGAWAETMLQYFNTDWNEIADKIPELAEAGYDSLWLPPPTKGSGGLSVGYDLWDPLDIGGREQRSTIRTRYGTEPELQRLIEIAHRFGIRIYFDNIMNHRAFDIPGYNEGTSINIYPGMVPEDFHLRKTEEGFYRKWDNCRDWQSAWQVMNLGLSDLIDIAHETPNDNFGFSEGDDHPKWSGVRHPDNPEYYLDTDLPIPAFYDTYSWSEYTFANKEPWQDVGYTNSSAVYVAAAAGNGKFDWEDTNGDGQHSLGEACEPFEDTGLDPTRPYEPWQTAARGYGDGIYNMGNPTVEDVGGYLNRAVRWLMDRTKADGLRLDAVKHVPDYFFGAYSSDTSSDGYTGQAQVQYNLSRGISDWENHRNSVFNTEIPRDDAIMFGEHLGSPPGYDGYFSTGMRLVDNDLRSKLNGVLGNPWASIDGLQHAGWGGFSADLGVMHAQSHDNDYAACKELQHAIYFTRAGLGLLYTDGNHHAETLGESGGAFPRWANTAFLGQWGDNRIPNLLYI